MPTRVHRLAAPLRPYVETCVGYDHRLDPDAVHHGLPSTSLTVIVAFDDPLDCGWLDDHADRRRARFDVLVAGLHTRPSLIRTHGVQRGIQLGLTPLGARALFGVPAGELAHEIVDATRAGLVPADLHGRLHEVDWPTRFALLEAALLARLGESTAPAPEVTEAWRRLRATGGRVRIDDLAAHVGWSRRHLLTRFRAEFGVTPKEAARLARFETARALLLAGHPTAEAAHAAGYADQPHLHREFRDLAALTPERMRRDTAQFGGPPTR